MEEQIPKVDKQRETVVAPLKLIEAFTEAKDAEWVYYALRNIPALTDEQRTTLCETIAATKDVLWAYNALRNIATLTEADRTTLCETIAATKNAEWADRALRIPTITEAQRTTLCEAIAAAKDAYWANGALGMRKLPPRQCPLASRFGQNMMTVHHGRNVPERNLCQFSPSLRFGGYAVAHRKVRVTA
jgi:hypothetical protein